MQSAQEIEKRLWKSILVAARPIRYNRATRIEKKAGKSSVVCSRLKLVADGKVLVDDASEKILYGDKLGIVYTVTLPDDIRGNNGVELQLQIKNTGSETTSGQVSLIGE